MSINLISTMAITPSAFSMPATGHNSVVFGSWSAQAADLRSFSAGFRGNGTTGTNGFGGGYATKSTHPGTGAWRPPLS